MLKGTKDCVIRSSGKFLHVCSYFSQHEFAGNYALFLWDFNKSFKIYKIQLKKVLHVYYSKNFRVPLDSKFNKNFKELIYDFINKLDQRWIIKLVVFCF